MDLLNVLTELRQERDRVTAAITSLEQMAISHQNRRGRPPAWMVTARQEPPVKKRGRPRGSRNKKKQ